MTEADLATIRDAAATKTHRVAVVPVSSGKVVVKSQRAERSAWRARLGNGLARLAGLSFLQVAASASAAQAQATEIARLRSLHAAGVRVPEVLLVEPGYFVMSHFAGPSLIDAIDGNATEALAWWQRGMQAIVALHGKGQYLSQAFARNLIVADAGLAMIDFEDDPGATLTLDEAQARDWLAYLHSTTWKLRPGGQALAATMMQQLGQERPGVRRLVEQAGRRLAWARRLPSTRRPLGREAVGLQALATLFNDAPGLSPLRT